MGKHLKYNGLYDNYHSAYRRGHSTETAPMKEAGDLYMQVMLLLNNETYKILVEPL